MDEFDQKLVDYAMDTPESYSAYQMQNFVINTQVGDFKQLNQFFLEINTREQARMVLELALATNEADKENKEEILKTDELTKYARKILELELRRDIYDLRVNTKKFKQATLELHVLIDSVKERFGTIEDVQQYLETNNEEKERHYWVSRMSRQAGIDIVTEGTINKGNMDAIIGMPEEDQVIALTSALQFSGKVNNAMKKIQDYVNENKDQLIDNQQGLTHSIDVCQLLLETETEQDSQPTDQSKVDGTSI